VQDSRPNPERECFSGSMAPAHQQSRRLPRFHGLHGGLSHANLLVRWRSHAFAGRDKRVGAERDLEVLLAVLTDGLGSRHEGRDAIATSLSQLRRRFRGEGNQLACLRLARRLLSDAA
jgi:hypothetical protein